MERANVKKGGKELRAYILYFLGCFYHKIKDTSEAKRKLAECVKLKSGAEIESSARELLGNIWDNVIRPPFWEWWLCSPLNRWPRRVIFGVILSSILALLVIHPFIPAWFPALQINWIFYTALILLLIIILVLPSIQLIRVRDVEVELRSPPAIGPVLSPPIMEEKLKELEVQSERRGSVPSND